MIPSSLRHVRWDKVIRKLAVALLTIVALSIGAGWYLWEKNTKVITQLDEMEKSLLEDAQKMPLESGVNPGKIPGSPGTTPGIPGKASDIPGKAHDFPGKAPDFPGKAPAGTLNETNPANNSNTPEKKEAGVQEKDKPGSFPKKIDMSDRAEVMAIVSSRLTSGDIKRLKELAQGGLTPEEKKEAKAIVRARLSRDEIERLKAISRKYR